MLKFLTSFSFACAGLSYALCRETNFRVQWLCATVVFLLISILSFSYFEQIIVLILSAGVLSLELLNSALEQLANDHGTENSLSKKHGKDLAASSVLLFSLCALLVFFLITANYLQDLLIKIITVPTAFICLIILIGLNFFMCIKNPGLLLSIFLVSISTILHAVLAIQTEITGMFGVLALVFHGLLSASNLWRAYS